MLLPLAECRVVSASFGASPRRFNRICRLHLLYPLGHPLNPHQQAVFATIVTTLLTIIYKFISQRLATSTQACEAIQNSLSPLKKRPHGATFKRHSPTLVRTFE
jgi:hypothetical protein